MTCTCRTCCVVEMMLRGAMVTRGWSREAALKVTVASGEDGPHAALASVKVDGREVYRIHEAPDEALDPAVLDDVEVALAGGRTNLQLLAKC